MRIIPYSGPSRMQLGGPYLRRRFRRGGFFSDGLGPSIFAVCVINSSAQRLHIP